MPNDGRYPSAKPLTAMKTFKFEVDNTEYQAENYVNGIFINPVLGFWEQWNGNSG
jgi:hypothetical protein